MKKLLYAAVALLCLSACTSNRFKTVKIDNFYTLDVPSYMKKTDKLSEIASLQYYDLSSEFFVMVVSQQIDTVEQLFIDNDTDEEYTNGLEGYAKYIINKMTRKYDSYTLSPLKYEKINGMEAIIIDWVAEKEGDKACFKKAFIKAKSYYYQITLSVLDTKKRIYEKTMDRIIHSFKEL